MDEWVNDPDRGRRLRYIDPPIDTTIKRTRLQWLRDADYGQIFGAVFAILTGPVIALWQKVFPEQPK